MKAFRVESFNVWAESQEEANEMRQAFIDFIDEHGKQGRFVSARKVTEALRNWKSNVLVRNRIIEHLSK